MGWGFHEDLLACPGVHTGNSRRWHISCLASARAGDRKIDAWGEGFPEASSPAFCRDQPSKGFGIDRFEWLRLKLC